MSVANDGANVGDFTTPRTLGEKLLKNLQQAYLDCRAKAEVCCRPALLHVSMAVPACAAVAWSEAATG